MGKMAEFEEKLRLNVEEKDKILRELIKYGIENRRV